MNKIVKVITGSRLYGTENPSSDYDFRGVYIPTLRECYSQAIKDSIDTKEGNDESWFSIQKFIDMAMTGQPVAIEMLFSGDKAHKFKPPGQAAFGWDFLVANRFKFLTKNMSAFLGFAKSLSGKYAVKIDRANALDDLISFVEKQPPNDSIADIWDILPTNEYFERQLNFDGPTFYSVLSRKYRDNTSLKTFLAALVTLRTNYGARVNAAKNNEWDAKSVSHAFRICYQLKQIALTGNLSFPLEEADFLRKIKNGEIDCLKVAIFDDLDREIKQVEQLLAKAGLPDAVDENLRMKLLDYFYLEIK